MKKIEAKIIADSIDPRDNRITSFILTYPRFIHSELMTHRMFSRNSASSRAIPFEKMLKMVNDDCFIPIAWQRDHKGMQGTEYIDPYTDETCSPRSDWLDARDRAMDIAMEMNEDDITKQLCNRLLEPFMWHTVLVTATEFSNFFDLRCPKYSFGKNTNNPKLWKSKKDAILEFPDWKERNNFYWYSINESQAEIHMQALAEAMWDSYNESTPKELQEGQFHIPFGDKINFELSEEEVLKIAVARCARLSYMTFDGEIDYEKDIKLHDQLLASKHASPFEHVAKCMTELEYYSFVKGKIPIATDEWGIFSYEHYSVIHNAMYEEDPVGVNSNNPNIYGWCNNFRGFIPYRYLIEKT